MIEQREKAIQKPKQPTKPTKGAATKQLRETQEEEKQRIEEMSRMEMIKRKNKLEQDKMNQLGLGKGKKLAAEESSSDEVGYINFSCCLFMLDLLT